MGRNDWKSMGALCFALVLAAAWPLQAAQASIDEACIANNADLKTALNKAQSSPLKIKLQTGTYDLANTVWHNGYLGGVIVRPGSQLIGGYSSACASRNIAYNNTILTDSAGGTPVDGADIMGDLTVEGVTAKVALAFSVGKYSITNPSTIEFLRDAFVNANGTLGIDWEKGGDSDSTLRVVDSLISKSSSFCPLVVEVFFKSPDIQWINNTLIDNPSGYGGCFFNNSSLGGSPAATLYAYNNIFFGTTADVNQYDFYADNDRVVLVDNIIGAGKRGGTPPISETGTKTTDPNLGVDFVPQMPSSAINTGSNAVPGTLPTVDLDGNDRLVGSNVDRGALESIVDFSNVQMVTKHGFDDGSAGTLSAAISNINTGGGTIKFNIGDGGSCPWVITLGDELDISANATINGYSQSGTSVNGLDIGDDANICIIVEAGTGATPPTRGMVVPSTAADGVSVTIRGIAFSGFTTAGVDLQGGSQHSVLGNHFGGNVGGHAMVTNGFDIRLGPATHDNTIGSTGDADRNIVGDATGSGIVVSDGSANNQIINNYVGIGWNTAGSGSFTNRGNGARGLYVAGDHNTLSANLIAFNVQAGIVLDGGGANNNVISGNFIGTTGTANLGNGAAGIHLIGDSTSTGDAPNDNTIRSNIIGQNSAQGVIVDVGRRNTIRKNAIRANALLGIDLDVPGVASPQDDDGAGQTPDYANRGQNFPVLTRASGGIGAGLVIGTLTTTPGDYTVDFYLASTCTNSYREGSVWLGAATVTVPSPTSGDQGIGPITAQIASPEPTAPFIDGTKISSTATDSNGNTSEFSACASYTNDGIFANGFEQPPG